ncbi:hypothetical protein LZ30DRAFT_608340, partial [Colletotrichum cereale]
RVKDTKGCSLLGHLVAQGQSDKIWPMLRRERIDVDIPDDNGRTPLMEAALWGQVDNVSNLLDTGANPCLADERGMAAADYAAETSENDKERHQRHSSYVEDPYLKKAERANIRALLGSPPVVSRHLAWPLNNSGDLFFYKSPECNTISFFPPKSGNQIRYQYKTAAVLRRGDLFAPCLAVSGWSGANSETTTKEAGFERLDAAYWTHRTFTIARRIGFDFPANKYDHKDRPGSYHACHAEAQLMSFYLDKYFTFQCDENCQKVDKEYVQLCLIQEARPEARIDVSQYPCQCCQLLRDHIAVKIGIPFHFVLAKEVFSA